MSKSAAIDYAVRRQLAAGEKHSPNTYKEIMGEAPAGAGAAVAANYYGYTESSIITFLVEVANQLRLDTPPYICEWAALDLRRCLSSTVAGMEAYIASVTTPQPP